MAYQPTRSKGTGKAGSKSSRYQKRAPAKKAASKTRRVEDKVSPWEAVEGSIDAVHLWPSNNVGLCGRTCGPAQHKDDLQGRLESWEAITCRQCLTLASDPEYVDHRDGFILGAGLTSCAKNQLERLDALGL